MAARPRSQSKNTIRWRGKGIPFCIYPDDRFRGTPSIACYLYFEAQGVADRKVQPTRKATRQRWPWNGEMPYPGEEPNRPEIRQLR
jgi:hypothetical protein